ncbi:MAG: hypothetical protein IT431_12175 [Phycisphaerales bacterium]|nr:hypothetical protein [Phycisphaerales bacterium]
MNARALALGAGVCGAGAALVVQASSLHIGGSSCRLEACTTTEAQPAEPGYVGVSVRDTPDGVVVGWVYPGPLGGDGFNSAVGLRRGDNIDAVYRGSAIAPEHRVEIATAAAYNEFVDGLAPGETLSIEARRSPEAVADGSVPKGGPGGEVTVYSVTVAPRRQWTGTVRRGLAGRQIGEAREGEFERLVLEAADEVGVRRAEGGLDPLLAYLARVQEENLDPNSLACVVRAFRRPLSVDAVEGEIAVLTRGAAAGDAPGMHGYIKALIAHVLDLPAYDGAALDAAISGMDLAQVRDDLRGLIAWQRVNISVGGEQVEPQIRAINATEGTVGPYLAFLLHASDTMLGWEAVGSAYRDAQPLAEIPEDLRQAVTGEILHIERFENGTIGVVGGPGVNSYDIAVVTDVYDTGGDDRYTFASADDAPAGGNHHIIDLAGDDSYEATTAFAGPGVGVMGISIVDDRAGDDTYRSASHATIGAGVFGVGLLIDHAGDDRYENLGPDSGWSIGCGYYGAGLVVDRGGSDTYLGEQLTQGVGGARGFGAILDASGDDSYKANGPSFGSVYGTEGVYKGFSQGFGIGVRGYAAGGLGAIYDLAGADRYEAGEFAQGCAYFWAFGLLHDAAGDDVYVGNRYGQASAAHQAVGVLIDDAGDDSYWSMTAASQAGVWDQSVAVLIDRAGDDRYEADGLAQGSASMQAVGLLLDLGGADTYLAKGGSQQGQGGGNSYHYDADSVFSFSGLFDLGGGADSYSSGRGNGTVVSTGAFNEGSPGDSDLAGVFCDRE